MRFLLCERGHDRKNDVFHHSARVEKSFHERTPRYAPAIQLREVNQRLPRAFSAQAVQLPEQQEVESPLTCVKHHAFELWSFFFARAGNGINVFGNDPPAVFS